MTCKQGAAQSQFDPGDNCRVTRIGKFLRRTKIDELPELINVLKGEMSIVGPRPEVEKYVREHLHDFRQILKNRPGLSDLASIKYSYEESILACHSNPELYYVSTILPDKLELAKTYVKRISFKNDFRIICETLKSIVLARQTLE
jgi:lipopolysaccharide/colanic/teichoic acid biosynthesis glycosyltransferase